MIIYNTKSWITIIKKAFRADKAYNTKALSKALLFILLYTSTITVLNVEFFNFQYHLSPTFFSLIGVILGLTLVFRLNSAYDRWWEGRKQWGALVNDSRTMASNLNSLLAKEDFATRKYLGAQIANFAYALAGHLRENIKYEEMDDMGDADYIQELKKSNHKPHKIASLIFEKMEEKYKKGVFADVDKLNIKEQIEQLINILGACERIKKTPIPFSHSSFMKSFIMLYSLALPFGLVNTFYYSTILAAGLIGYALAGVEIISEEIENPFGMDANDLPLTHLSNIIKENVYSILEIPLDKELPQALRDHHILS